MVDQKEIDPKLSGYRTPHGVSVEIAATEPVVVNPVGMHFSEDGSLYVLEWTKAHRAGSEAYDVTLKDGTRINVLRSKKDTRDVLKRLIDTNQDGIYDKAEVVMNDLELPSSVVVRENWFYIPSIGHLVRRTRSQLNGPFDKEQEILRGFSGHHHHQISGVAFGHAGMMYVSAGDSDNRGEGSDGSRIEVLRSGVIARSTSNGRRLTEFARGFRNPYRNVTFDQYFNMFHADNDEEDGSKFTGVRLMHVVEGADFGWRLQEDTLCCRGDVQRGAVFGELPGKLPALIKTGRGAASGLYYYSGQAFPSALQGLLLYPDVYNKSVRAYRVKPRGATFAVVEAFTLMESEDPLFRPCQVTMGPDGAIYVLDWRTDSSGAAALWGDGIHGRIYRLRWSGTAKLPELKLHPPDRWAQLSAMGDQKLIDKLSLEDFETRERIVNVLVRRGVKHRKAFLELFFNREAPITARIHALGGMQQLWNDQVESALVEGLRDSNPNIRRLAADGLGIHLRADQSRDSNTGYRKPGKDVYEALRQQFQVESDLLVKRQLALALAKIYAHLSIPTIVQSIFGTNEDDAYYRDGLIRALEHTGSRGFSPLISRLQSDDAEERELALATFEAFRTRSAADALAEALTQSEKLTPQQRVRLFTSYRNYQFDTRISASPLVRWIDSHPRATTEEKLAAFNAVSLLGAELPQRFHGKIVKMLDNSSDRVRSRVLEVIDSQRVSVATDALIALVEAQAVSLLEKRKLLDVISRVGSKSATEFLVNLSQREGELQADALEALAVNDFNQAILQSHQMISVAQNEKVVSIAARIMGSTAERAKLLGSLYLENRIPLTLLPVVIDSLEKHAPGDSEAMSLLNQIRLGSSTHALDAGKIASLETDVKLRGRQLDGMAIFLTNTKVNCISCHRLEGVGGGVGPDLTNIWRTHSVAQILESLIEPSKVIREAYKTFTLETKQGRVIFGKKLEDNNDRVVMSDIHGNVIAIDRGQIKSLEHAGRSLMPEGTISRLKYQEVINLISFLKSSRFQKILRTLSYQWWVSGTYSGELDYRHPPQQISTHPAKRTVASEQLRPWRSAAVSGIGSLNLGWVFGSQSRGAVYALTYLESQIAQQAELVVYTSDSYRVWINGVAVQREIRRKDSSIIEKKTKIQLQKGWNTILGKVIKTRDASYFDVRIVGADKIRFARYPVEEGGVGASKLDQTP